MLSAISIGYIFPQRFSTSAQEMEKWDKWSAFIKVLGLDHVYSTWWFALLLLLFVISLSISTYEQIKLSLRRTFGGGTPSGKTIKTGASFDELKSAIRKRGYIRTHEDEEGVRLLKHPWGYWGNTLFHLGILVVIASSLLIVLTEKRGLLNLVEGEVFLPGNHWTTEEKGVLGGEFLLPEAVRLEDVTAEFWETDDLKQLTTGISFIDPEGNIRENGLAINQVLDYRGMRIYQGTDFGKAFYVEFIDPAGNIKRQILQIGNPIRKDKAGYGNFGLEDRLLKAKYYADADKKTMISENPLLVMRLIEGGEIIGEASLIKGAEGTLGHYKVNLVEILDWAGVIFVKHTGMPGIFLGFFIIIVGSMLYYFTPPREFYITKRNGGIAVAWKAVRFEDFYKDEYEKIAGHD